MVRFVGLLLMAVLLLAGPASLPAFAQAKDKEKEKEKEKGEPASFETADGVLLKGTYYPSAKRQAAPGTVLMLHAMGESSQKKDWKELAEELQKKDFAVLLFDFRGHGQSTEVNPQTFWANVQDPQQYNQRLVKGYNPGNLKQSIKVGDFSPQYYPALINDIAAAKAYLDRKNDNRECNTSNFMLVGAQDGALLGSLWLHSEYSRYRVIEDMVLNVRRPEKNAEGKDVVACVWLSMSDRIKGRQVPLSSVFYNSGKLKATPMMFLYGDQDTTAKDIAKTCERNIRIAKEKEKYAFTSAHPVPDTKLKGVALLTNPLPTQKTIVKYLQDVATDKNNEWFNRDYRKTSFIWINPRPLVPIIPGANPMLDPRWYYWAKPVQESVCLFDTYEKFIPR